MDNTYSDKFMKYGDLIIFMGSSTNPKHGKVSGFLSCIGFTDSRVFFQRVPEEPLNQALKQSFSLAAKNHVEQVNVLNFIANYEDFVFQVWPRLRSDNHKEYRKKLKERDILRSRMKQKRNLLYETIQNVKSQTRTDNQVESARVNMARVMPMSEGPTPELQQTIQKGKDQVLLESIENKISQLIEELEEEKKNNESLMEYSVGQPVTYGCDIQLMHFPSKCFLNGRILASDAEKSAYSFVLQDSYAGGMSFRFLPKFKLRQVGEVIQYNDMVIIMNVKLNCYTNFGLDETISIDKRVDSQNIEDLIPQQDLRQNDPRTPRYESFLSLFSDTSWQVIRHGRAARSNKQPNINVRGSQMIRLMHTETNEPLTADIAYLNKNPEAHLRLYTGDARYSQECRNSSSIWQLEPDLPFHRGLHLKFKSDGDGTQQHLRLRHLLTGKLLGLSEVQMAGSMRKIFVLLPNEDLVLGNTYDIATRVSLIPTVQSSSLNVQNGSCYHLQVGGLFLKTMVNPEFIQGRQSDQYFYLRNTNPVKIDQFYQQLSDPELGVERKALEFMSGLSEENAFWIETVVYHTSQQYGFILSTVPSIVKFLKIIKDRRIDMLTTEYMRDFLKTLNALIKYIKQIERSNKQELQRQLKNCNFLEYLTQILYWPFKNKIIIPGRFREVKLDFLNILQACQQLIRVIIKEYRPNELYMAQWIDLLLEQSVIQDPFFDITAGQTLTELIDNNRFVLETKIQASTMERFIQELLGTLEIKYLKLLRALINCDGSAMVGSQSYISKRILSTSNQVTLIPAVEFNGQHLRIALRSGRMVKLEVFEEESKNEDQEVQYSFFLNLMEFLSDLCLEKNFLAISTLQEVFSLEMCKFVVKNINYTSEVRAAFAKLTLTLWIEGKKMVRLSLPNYVRSWDQVTQEKNIELLSSRQDVLEFNEFKPFIIAHLKGENNRYFQRTFFIQENRFTFIVLEILQALLIYGLFKDKSEMQALVKPLMGYINASNDVTTKDEEMSKEFILIEGLGVDQWRKTRNGKHSKQFDFQSRYLDNRKTQQLSESRSLICKILKFMQQLTVDMQATLVLRDLKQYQEDQRQDAERKQLEQQKIDRGGIRGGLSNIKKGFKSVVNILPINLIFDNLNPLNLFKTEDFTNEPDLIPLIWINDALANKDTHIQGNINSDLVPIGFDLIMYQNVELISQAFILLNEAFSLKINLLRFLKEIQIIDDPIKRLLLNEVQKSLEELQILSDTSENWYALGDGSQRIYQRFIKTVKRWREILVIPQEPIKQSDLSSLLSNVDKEELQQDNQQFIRVGDDDEGLIDNRIMISPSDNKKQFKNKDHPEFLGGIFEQELKLVIRSEFQKMMRNLQVYKPLIALINFDLQSVNTKHDEMTAGLLREIYLFLAYFCFNDSANRLLLRPYIKIFRKHLERNRDILAHLVLQEMYRNNREILMNQRKLSKMVRGVCGTLESMKFDDPLRVFFLDSMNIFMRIDGRVQKMNQMIVINRIFSLRKVLYRLDTEEERKDLFKIAGGFSEKFEQLSRQPNLEDQEIQLPKTLDYLLVLLKVMATASEDKNTGAESKCQTYFSIKKIYSILQVSRKCWPLRLGLMQFYFHVFLETEKDWEDLNGQIPFLCHELLNDIKYLSHNLQYILDSQVRVVNFQQVQSGRAIVLEYLINFLVPVLSYLIKTNRLNSCKNLKAMFTPAIKDIFHFLTYNNRAIKQSMTRLLAYIEQNKRICQDEVSFQELKKQYQIDNTVIQQKEKLKSKITKSNVNLGSKTINDIPQPILGLNDILFLKLQTLSKHNTFKQQVELEIEVMVNQLMSIEQVSKAKFKYSMIKWEDMMGKMVNLIDLRTQPRLSNNLVMVGLKVFRKIIERANPTMSIPAADWNFKDYRRYEKKILFQQERLIKLGVVQVLCSTITMDLVAELKYEALLVASAILLTGNQEAQAAFTEFFETDHKNLFIIKVHELIDQNFTIIKKYCDYKIQDREYSLKNNGAKLIKFDDENDDEGNLENEAEGARKDVEEGDELETVFMQSADEFETLAIINNRRVIRFMQLLCEGHNLKMQDYLRHQSQRGEQNGKSINLVQYMSLKTGVLIKSLCVENIGLLIQMMRLMIEMSQGPCFKNQESLVGSKIVDFCSEVIQMFNSVEDEEKQTEDKEPNIHQMMLAHLNEGFSGITNIFIKKEKKAIKLSTDQQRRGFINEALLQDFNVLLTESTTLLLSLLEANPNDSIAAFMQESLELIYLRLKITHSYKNFVNEVLGLPSNAPLLVVQNKTQDVVDFYQGEISDALNFYILLITLDYLMQARGTQNNLASAVLNIVGSEVEQNAMDFFKRSVGNVEIFYNNRLVKVFFPIEPTCRNLSKSSRVSLMQTVKRVSPNDKINGLIAASPILFTEMHHMSYLKSLPFQFTSQRLQILRDISTILAFLINLILIGFNQRDLSHNQSYVNSGMVGSITTQSLILGLGLAQLVTSSLMLSFWVVINIPVILKTQWNNLAESSRLEVNQRIETEVYDVNRDPSQYTTEQISYLMRTKGPYSAYFERGDQRYLGCMFAKVLYYIKSFIFLCSDSSFIYMFLYISISILGQKSELIYSLHLLDIINRSDILKNVVRSVTTNFKQLALTFLLMAIVIYIYSLIGYTFFPDNYHIDSLNESGCVSVLQCYLMSVLKGLLNGGGVAESLRLIDYHENYTETYHVRLIFDLTFFCIITIMFLNIIFGIIIDSFAELRDSKNDMIDDMNTRCKKTKQLIIRFLGYICNLDRQVLEKSEFGFDLHIENEHHLWDYLYFLHYIDNKYANEYNGIESHCVRLLDKLDIGWFPIMKAMSLKVNDEDESFALKTQKQLQTLNRSVGNVVKQVQGLVIFKK